MAVVNQSYSFCADYSAIATCLFAIEAQEDAGAFDSHPEILERLRIFEFDLLKKLMDRTLIILGIINGDIPDITGDFSGLDFSEIDFFVGNFDTRNGDYIDVAVGNLKGDFSRIDYSHIDFYVGYLDETNPGYSSKFQTIINIFVDFCLRSAEIKPNDVLYLDYALIPVLNAFEELRNYLDSLDLNPCIPAAEAYFNNSPDLYLQAAGSDGTDGTAEGIHLRWSLVGELGLNHIPQGDYTEGETGQTGYNQENDFVYISRIPYANMVRVNLDFETSRPVINSGLRQWSYLINSSVEGKHISNTIRLNFADEILYNELALTVSPLIYPFLFLKAYTGIIEIEVVNKPAFVIAFDFRKEVLATNAVLKAEIFSVVGVGGTAEDTLTAREILEISSGGQVLKTVFAENIHHIRYKKTGGSFLQAFAFETYHDFMTIHEEEDWMDIGSGFALSLDDELVFDRLENSNYTIDQLWPQYNEGTTVKVVNYEDKWSVSRTDDPSVKDTVSQYLLLSQTDPRAEEEFKAPDADPEDPGLIISYVDVLNMLALDFHVARMLGLGHIDVPSDAPADKFIYRIRYRNRKSLASSEMINRQFFSLPTGRLDKRLPSKAQIRPLSHQLPVNNELSESTFDELGYSAVSDIRIVNIGRQPFVYELPLDDFFDDPLSNDVFNVFEQTKPVFYGIKYRAQGQSEYVKPEIQSHDQLGHLYYAYDTDHIEGVLETSPLPDNLKSLYIHFEKQTGIHHYAIYGINWFSRASELSEEEATDATVFDLKNTLLPPTDVSVQYIQKEDTLLFTSVTEQHWLTGRNEAFEGEDTSFTRLNFNWLDIIDISHIQDIEEFEPADVVKADIVRILFKPEPPLESSGLIVNVINGPKGLAIVRVSGYERLDGSMVDPTVSPADFGRFVGSFLTTEEGQFLIKGLATAVGGLNITIERSLRGDNIADTTASSTYGVHEYYLSPLIGSRFSMIENLGDKTNWEILQETIELMDLSGSVPQIETETDAEGNESHYLIGGITANAIISPKLDLHDEPIPGYYRISYEAGVVLAAHPQVNLPYDSGDPTANPPGVLHGPNVEWYKGLARVPFAEHPEDKKLLEVLLIEQSDPLTITIYDPTAGQDPETDIPVSSSPTDFIPVNFHPGYKAYLFPEPEPAQFNSEHIEPAAGFNDKKTLVAMLSADLAGTDYESRASSPLVLLARTKIEPVQLEAPVPLNLRVRPNEINRAAFTCDIRIQPAGGQPRNPFGFMFYRLSSQDLLEALYEPVTIANILADLDSLVLDLNFDERYAELANIVYDPANPGHFKVFYALPEPYGFPDPDKAGLVEEEDTLEVKTQKYRALIQAELLPLTQQPPIYPFIKTGLQTENKEPVIRSLDGNLLEPTDPDFDPFPMARKYTKVSEPNTVYVRFTDYSLSAASRFLYFYAAVELTNQLIPGPLSPYTGPVTIIHTSKDDAPIIRSFSLGEPVIVTDSPIAVTFQLSPFLSDNKITKVRIFRTQDQSDTGSLYTMENYIDADLSIDADSGIEVTDTFEDLQAVPLGSTLYYRLAAVRIVINEKEELEEVVSMGSEVIVVKLIDTVNPLSPEITYDEVENSLSWETTANKGTYYLYKQNARGNWELIYQVQPPDGTGTIEYILPEPLPTVDEDGDTIYNRFKVKVENSSGLFSLIENELTI